MLSRCSSKKRKVDLAAQFYVKCSSSIDVGIVARTFLKVFLMKYVANRLISSGLKCFITRSNCMGSMRLCMLKGMEAKQFSLSSL